MEERIPFLKKENIVSVTPLLKGWSRDQKYVLEDANGCKFLLRISDGSLWEKKKAQFALLEKMEKRQLPCSRPLALGMTEEGSVYTIVSYLEGTDGLKAVSKLGNREAYRLGIEAGEVLRRLHEIEIPTQKQSWWERYQEKMPRKIAALRKCEYRLPMQEELLQYYTDHCWLMKNRPQLFAHGDFHLGNMIVKGGKIGIIDFDKNGAADPYDEFKPFCWNVMCSEYFETGLINGYFQNQVPEDFFPILKFYTVESLISHLPWSVTFGEAEVRTAQKVAANQMIWYDHFQLEVPTWYHGIL